MGSPSDAPERVPYQRALEAIFEVAQVLLTLHTVATLDAKDMRSLVGLVVENITALLDDLQRGHHTSQRLRDYRAFDVHLAIASAAESDPQAAAYYRQLDKAVRDVEDTFRGLTVAKIDALAVTTRSNLDYAIRDAKDAFTQLAKAEGPPDPALLTAIGQMRAAIDGFSGDLDSLGNERTLGVSDGVSRSVPMVDAPSYWRSVGEDTHHGVSRSVPMVDAPSY